MTWHGRAGREDHKHLNLGASYFVGDDTTCLGEAAAELEMVSRDGADSDDEEIPP